MNRPRKPQNLNDPYHLRPPLRSVRLRTAQERQESKVREVRGQRKETMLPTKFKPGEKVIYRWKGIRQCAEITEDINVIFLAASGNYAMVRRKGCMPYVCDIRDLRPSPATV